MSTATVYFLLPEIVLITAAVVIYIAGAFFQTDKTWRWLALAGIVLAIVCLNAQPTGTDSGGMISDGFTV